MPLNSNYISRLRSGLFPEAVRNGQQIGRQTFAQNFLLGNQTTLDSTNSLLQNLGQGFYGADQGFGQQQVSPYTQQIEDLLEQLSPAPVPSTPTFLLPGESSVDGGSGATPAASTPIRNTNPDAVDPADRKFLPGGSIAPSSNVDVSQYRVAGTSETGQQLREYSNGRLYSDTAISQIPGLLEYVNRVAGPGLAAGSGFRSDSKQAGLARDDAAVGGGNAAAAGRSAHRTGNAVDFGVGGGPSNDPRLLAGQEYARQIGVKSILHKNCCGQRGYHLHIDFGTPA